MNIKMNETTKVSLDGVSVVPFVEGEVYNVPDELGKSLVKDKLATKTKKTIGPTETKEQSPSETKETGPTETPESGE